MRTDDTTATCPHALQRWGDHDRDDPFPLFTEVLDAGPVHDVTLADGHRAFLVVGYDAAREALAHPDLSKDMHAAMARDGEVVAPGLPGPDFARHMLNVDPPDHTRLRRLVTPAFTRRRLAALEPRIRAVADELVAGLRRDAALASSDGSSPASVDLMAGFAAPLPFAVLGELLGIDRGEQRRLAGWFATLLSPWDGAEPPTEVVTASDRIVGFLVDLVERRESDLAVRAAAGDSHDDSHDGSDDLVDDLVLAHRAGDLTRQELLSTIFQLLVAGQDTTANLIGNGTAALLAHPDQRDRLVADPDLVPHAVEEILRWDPPGQHATFRYATREVTIAGTTIPAGVQVLVSLVTAGRDGARTPRPESLDLEREGVTHLAFGHGVHHCLGARLARLEAEIAFTTLLTRFPTMRLAVPAESLRWDRGDGLVLRGLSELPVLLSGDDRQETSP
jgi:cytochrome P450